MNAYRGKGATMLAALLLAACVVDARPRPVGIEEIVAKTRALYNATSSAEIRFEQTGAGGASNGTLIYAQGNKYRLEYPKQTFISNGQRVWTYTPAAKQVVISKASTRNGRLTPNDILKSFPGDYATSLVREEKVNGRPVWVVRCVPKGERIGDVTEATLYIDKATYRFQQVAITGPSLGSLTLRIVSAKYDTKIPDSRFTFVPSGDMKVVDLTK